MRARTCRKQIAEAKQIDAVLDLVGNTTILDALDMLRRGGRACLAGWLGGLAPIADFNPLLQMASGVYLTFFGSFVFGTPGFPLSDVPLQKIAEQVATGRLEAKPSRVFSFEEIREAHRVMEANEPRGRWSWCTPKAAGTPQLVDQISSVAVCDQRSLMRGSMKARGEVGRKVAEHDREDRLGMRSGSGGLHVVASNWLIRS